MKPAVHKEEASPQDVPSPLVLRLRPVEVYIYQPEAPVQRLENPERISGDPVLPGFVLELREVW